MVHKFFKCFRFIPKIEEFSPRDCDTNQVENNGPDYVENEKENSMRIVAESSSLENLTSKRADSDSTVNINSEDDGANKKSDSLICYDGNMSNNEDKISQQIEWNHQFSLSASINDFSSLKKSESIVSSQQSNEGSNLSDPQDHRNQKSSKNDPNDFVTFKIGKIICFYITYKFFLLLTLIVDRHKGVYLQHKVENGR